MSSTEALTRNPGTASRSPGLRAILRRPLSLAHRARYLLLPIAAIIVVVALQIAQQPSAIVAPPAPQPASEADNQVTDVAPVGQPGAVAGVDTSDTDERIAYWQERLRSAPTSDTSWTYLGELYDVKGRQTGDLANYGAARDAFQKALDISPANAAAQIGLARIQATFHDFEGALASATAVVEAQPSATGALAIIFDAAYELGDMDIAELALTRLEERVESPAVTIRQARLAVLHGESDSAIDLAHQAASQAEDLGEDSANVAFYQYAAGEYAFAAGDIETAVAAYEASLEALPGYALGLAGLGRAAYVNGDLQTAITRLEEATANSPRPDLAAYLGDLYTVAGSTDRASAQYAAAEATYIAGSEAYEGVYAHEYTTYLADHARDLATAVQLARADFEQSNDVHAHDNLAWALYAANQPAEALAEITTALEMGPVDAKLLIHAGLIELANGLESEGEDHLEQGLALRPAFSPIVIEAAREALAP